MFFRIFPFFGIYFPLAPHLYPSLSKERPCRDGYKSRGEDERVEEISSKTNNN